MQVSPALPWTDDTEGGTIILASPVSYQDLLDGVLQFTLDHNGTPLIANVGEGSAGVVIGYGDGGTVNIVYTIDRFEGELTVLEITRGTGAQADGYALASVERVTPPVQVIPRPPLSDSDESVTIKLATPITQEEILQGELQFTLEEGGSTKVAEIFEGSSIGIGYTTGGSNYYVYSLAPFSGESSELTLSKVQGEHYNLSSVKRATGPLAEVYADQACTTRPVVGQSYSSLFVKVNKAINYGDNASFENGGGDFTFLGLNAPNDNFPQDPYSIQLYVEFFSADLSEGYEGVIECQTTEGTVNIQTPLQTDFGYVYE